ncbi:polysaccharide deacetylase family protein [Prosthecobacter sp.]|uniref:polysaccharide deacetylase family protein n=1 Tax=Prosthecobacter sp. TaxID=1965333 RepID=UPI002AB92AC0|nr:polysaccharide deacetylase family protein [Prosthecobacter sp.]MDZ4402578.1 polysaccharide deacetylase family protein [Prosthecobacter sp.]
MKLKSHSAVIALPLSFFYNRLAKAVLVDSGFAAFARTRHPSRAAILTFHGLCETADDADSLEWYLHLPMDIFEGICRLLRDEFRVVRLSDLIDAHARGVRLPDNAVVITFDDGFASNHALAYPILRKFGLPATIHVATGFLAGEDVLWFQRVDLALSRTQKPQLDFKINGKLLSLRFGNHAQRLQSLLCLMPEFKRLPDVELRREVDRLEAALEVKKPQVGDLPERMRPMSWDMAREMSASGQIEIGGHTMTHPILARCDAATMRTEIVTCRDRIHDELGKPPVSFAYPNGTADDFTCETMNIVREAGFKAACSMIEARVDEQTSAFRLPRYGAPCSSWWANAVVSGVFETFQEWKSRFKMLSQT